MLKISSKPGTKRDEAIEKTPGRVLSSKYEVSMAIMKLTKNPTDRIVHSATHRPSHNLDLHDGRM